MLVLKRRRNAITIQIEMVVGRSILLYHLYPRERVGGGQSLPLRKAPQGAGRPMLHGKPCKHASGKRARSSGATHWKKHSPSHIRPTSKDPWPFPMCLPQQIPVFPAKQQLWSIFSHNLCCSSFILSRNVLPNRSAGRYYSQLSEGRVPAHTDCQHGLDNVRVCRDTPPQLGTPR